MDAVHIVMLFTTTLFSVMGLHRYGEAVPLATHSFASLGVAWSFSSGSVTMVHLIVSLPRLELGL